MYPLFAVFGRTGTALVASATFLLVLNSYSSLEITFMQVLWTLLFSLLISLTLGTVPGLGSYVALSTLCAIYGKGLRQYILGDLLQPVSRCEEGLSYFFISSNSISKINVVFGPILAPAPFAP